MSERDHSQYRGNGRRGRQGAAWTPIARVCAVLQRKPDQFLDRYVSPVWIQRFTLTELWFDDPARYTKIGLFPTPVDPKATENTLRITGEHAIFLNKVKIVTTTVPGKPVLFVVFEHPGPGGPTQKPIEPKSRGSRLEYEAPMDQKVAARSVAFRFGINDQKNFRWVSASIVGFVC
jgi:hypothetical protein